MLYVKDYYIDGYGYASEFGENDFPSDAFRSRKEAEEAITRVELELSERVISLCLKYGFRPDFENYDYNAYVDTDILFEPEIDVSDINLESEFISTSKENGRQATLNLPLEDTDVQRIKDYIVQAAKENFNYDLTMRTATGKGVTIDEMIHHRKDLVAGIQNECKSLMKKAESYYAILQCKDETPYMFCSLPLPVDPEFEDYNILLVQELPHGTRDIEDTINYKSLCEDLFREYNLPDRPNHENGFYGHSMSVSDIVLVKADDDKMPKVFYADSYGFKELDFDKFFKNEKAMFKSVKPVEAER